MTSGGLSRRSSGTGITPILMHAYSRKTCSVRSGSEVAKKSPLAKPIAWSWRASAVVVLSKRSQEISTFVSALIIASAWGFSLAHLATTPWSRWRSAKSSS